MTFGQTRICDANACKTHLFEALKLGGEAPPALIKSAFSVCAGSAEPTHKVQGNVAFAQWPKGPSLRRPLWGCAF